MLNSVNVYMLQIMYNMPFHADADHAMLQCSSLCTHDVLSNPLSDSGDLALLDVKVGLLEISLVAGGGVDLLVAVVAVDGSLLWLLDLVLELELVGVLDDVCVDGLSVADVATLDVVLVLVESTLAMDGSLDAWVVLLVALDGDVEVPVAARGAAKDEVAHFEVVLLDISASSDWAGGCQSGGTESEEVGEMHVVGGGVLRLGCSDWFVVGVVIVGNS